MRISEVYLSIQGEGPRVGIPTIFVRFAGCNLRCHGWPCDTPHAIFPQEYRNEWKTQSPEEVYESILAAAKGRTFYNVCFTGGEPFLQPPSEIDTLINIILQDADIQTLECFSNGTLKYTDLALNYVAFVMDWKLPGSGEVNQGVQKRLDNFAALGYKDSVKFTIASLQDYDYAKKIYEDAEVLNPEPMWFAGVVWGKLKDADLIEWMLRDDLPWRHTMQVHNLIWDRTQRGI